MKLIFAIWVFACTTATSAEGYGYVDHIDPDGDGIDDTIRTGPMSMFGNGGDHL